MSATSPAPHPIYGPNRLKLGIFAGVQSQMYNAEQFDRLKFHLKAGFFGYPLLGPTNAIADDLLKLSHIWLDGILLVACDYYDELDRWGKHITPLLIESGLREAPESKT